jgi:hypothetical protein
VATKRIPDHTLSSYRDVVDNGESGCYYEDGDQQVAVSRINPEAPEGETGYEHHVRLPVSREFAIELATETSHKELSSATDAIIIDFMTRRFEPSIFDTFLQDNGWTDNGMGHEHGLHLYEHPDYRPRQIIYARTRNPESLKYVSEDIHDNIKKFSEIMNRPELGVRLELIRRSNSAKI